MLTIYLIKFLFAVTAETEMEPLLNNTNVRFWCPELTQEGQWRHLVLLFNKAGIMKNSSVSLFVDGQHVNTQKVKKITKKLFQALVDSHDLALSFAVTISDFSDILTLV